MGEVLSLTDVGFCYGPRWALRRVDLKIQPGELLGILGPNGSGKSTLLKIMDGLLAPSEGAVRLGGRPLEKLQRAEIARLVAMVGQESHFHFAFSVLEVVLMGRFAHMKAFQFENARDLQAASKALEATGALHLAERSIHELSGGEKQRVLIARALAQQPRIVLLDEPTSFLDLKYKQEIFRLISTLTGRGRLSVVVVSHDVDLAAAYCDNLVMLREGRIFAAGPPEQVVTRAHIETVYGCSALVDTNPATGRPRVSLSR